MSHPVVVGASGHVQLSELGLPHDAVIGAELPFHLAERVRDLGPIRQNN